MCLYFIIIMTTIKYNHVNLPNNLQDPITLNNFKTGDDAVRFTYKDKKTLKPYYSYYHLESFIDYIDSQQREDVRFHPKRRTSELPIDVSTRMQMSLNDLKMVRFTNGIKNTI